jgi:type VI secretion system secreted protein VgrG
VIGSLYNGVDAPPTDPYQSGGQVTKRTWRSREGHRIEITDSPDGDSILITTGDDGYAITLSKTDREIKIDSGGTVVVHSAQDIELTSDANVKISGVNVTVEASAGLELTGATAKLDGSGQTEVKGGVVRIN